MGQDYPRPAGSSPEPNSVVSAAVEGERNATLLKALRAAAATEVWKHLGGLGGREAFNRGSTGARLRALPPDGGPGARWQGHGDGA